AQRAISHCWLRSICPREFYQARWRYGGQRFKLLDHSPEGRRVALFIACHLGQRFSKERLLGWGPAVEAIEQRQHKACFAGAEAPFIGFLPQERCQQILTLAVEILIDDSLRYPA